MTDKDKDTIDVSDWNETPETLTNSDTLGLGDSIVSGVEKAKETGKVIEKTDKSLQEKEEKTLAGRLPFIDNDTPVLGSIANIIGSGVEGTTRLAKDVSTLPLNTATFLNLAATNDQTKQNFALVKAFENKYPNFNTDKLNEYPLSVRKEFRNYDYAKDMLRLDPRGFKSLSQAAALQAASESISKLLDTKSLTDDFQSKVDDNISYSNPYEKKKAILEHNIDKLNNSIDSFFSDDEDMGKSIADITESISNIVSDGGKLIAEQVYNTVSNPAQLAKLIANTAPDMLAASTGVAQMATVTAGYAMDVANDGIKAYQKNAGRNPNDNELTSIMTYSLVAGTADLLGAANLNKVITGTHIPTKAFFGKGAAKEEIEEVATKNIKENVGESVKSLEKSTPIKNIFDRLREKEGVKTKILEQVKKLAPVTGVAKTSLSEGATEGVQEISEQKAKGEDLDAGAIFRAISSGVAVGGALATAKAANDFVTKTDKFNAIKEKYQTEVQTKKAISEFSTTGDSKTIEELPEADQMSIISKYLEVELSKEGTKIEDYPELQKRQVELHNKITDTTSKVINELNKVKADNTKTVQEKQSADAKGREILDRSIQVLSEHTAYSSDSVSKVFNQIKDAYADLESKDTQEAFSLEPKINDRGKIEYSLEARKLVKGKDLGDIAFHSFLKNTNTFSADNIKDLLNDRNIFFDKYQTKLLQAYEGIARMSTKAVDTGAKNKYNVVRDVILGGKGYPGIKDYHRMLHNSVVLSDNKQLTEKVFGNYLFFVNNHKEKYESYEKAVRYLANKDLKRAYLAYRNNSKNNVPEEYRSSVRELLTVEKSYNINVLDRKFPNLVNTISKEVKVIDEATELFDRMMKSQNDRGKYTDAQVKSMEKNDKNVEDNIAKRKEAQKEVKQEPKKEDKPNAKEKESKSDKKDDTGASTNTNQVNKRDGGKSASKEKEATKPSDTAEKPKSTETNKETVKKDDGVKENKEREDSREREEEREEREEDSKEEKVETPTLSTDSSHDATLDEKIEVENNKEVKKKSKEEIKKESKEEKYAEEYSVVDYLKENGAKYTVGGLTAVELLDTAYRYMHSVENMPEYKKKYIKFGSFFDFTMQYGLGNDSTSWSFAGAAADVANAFPYDEEYDETRINKANPERVLEFFEDHLEILYGRTFSQKHLKLAKIYLSVSQQIHIYGGKVIEDNNVFKIEGRSLPESYPAIAPVKYKKLNTVKSMEENKPKFTENSEEYVTFLRENTSEITVNGMSAETLQGKAYLYYNTFLKNMPSKKQKSIESNFVEFITNNIMGTKDGSIKGLSKSFDALNSFFNSRDYIGNPNFDFKNKIEVYKKSLVEMYDLLYSQKNLRLAKEYLSRVQQIDIYGNTIVKRKDTYSIKDIEIVKGKNVVLPSQNFEVNDSESVESKEEEIAKEAQEEETIDNPADNTQVTMATIKEQDFIEEVDLKNPVEIVLGKDFFENKKELNRLKLEKREENRVAKSLEWLESSESKELSKKEKKEIRNKIEKLKEKDKQREERLEQLTKDFEEAAIVQGMIVSNGVVNIANQKVNFLENLAKQKNKISYFRSNVDDTFLYKKDIKNLANISNIYTTLKKFMDDNFVELPKEKRVNDYLQYFLSEQKTDLAKNLVSSSLTGAVHSWLVGEGKNTLTSNMGALNALMGNNAAKVMNEDAKYRLSKYGTFRSNIIESLGSHAYKIMGVKLNEEVASYSDKAKLITSLGSYAFAYMESTGLISKIAVPTSYIKSVITDPQGLKMFNDRYGKVKTVDFYAISRERSKNNKHFTYNLNSKVDNYIKMASNSRIYEKLFGTKGIRPMPMYTPPKSISKIYNNSDQKIPKKAYDKLLKLAKKPYERNTSLIKAFSMLKPSTIQKITGMQELNDVMTDSQKMTVEGKNLTYSQSLALLQSFNNEMVAENKDKFYLDIILWRNGRIGNSNAIDPYGDKLHRHMFALSEVKSVLKIKSRSDMFGFKSAVAQAFGFDKKGDAINVKEFESLLGEGSAINKAVEAINVSKEGKVVSNYDSLIVDAVNMGGGDIQTLNGLSAYAAYIDAINKGKSSFQTHLTKNSDGTANGTAISLAQFGYDPKQGNSITSKVGVSSDKNYTSKSEYFAGGKLDLPQYILYQGTNLLTKRLEDASKFIKVMGEKDKITKKEEDKLGDAKKYYKYMKAFKNLIGNVVTLDENDNPRVSKLGRSIGKDVITKAIYSAETDSVSKSIGEMLWEKIEDKVYEVNNLTEDGYDTYVDFIDKLNSILPAKLQYGKQPKELMSVDKIVLSPEVKNILLASGAMAYGETTFDSFRESFNYLRSNSKKIVYAYNEINNVYIDTYNIYKQHFLIKRALNIKPEGEYNTIKASKRRVKLPSFATSEFKLHDNQYKALSKPITIKEEKEILAQVEKFKPTLPTMYSEGIDDSLSFVKKIKVKQEGEHAYRSDVSLKNGKKISSYGFDSEYTAIGVSPAPIGVQSIDAAIMLNTLDKFAGNNVFDEIMMSIKEANQGSEYINKMYVEANTKYSIIDETSKRIKDVMDGIESNSTALIEEAVKSKDKVTMEFGQALRKVRGNSFNIKSKSADAVFLGKDNNPAEGTFNKRPQMFREGTTVEQYTGKPYIVKKEDIVSNSKKDGKDEGKKEVNLKKTKPLSKKKKEQIRKEIDEEMYKVEDENISEEVEEEIDKNQLSLELGSRQDINKLDEFNNIDFEDKGVIEKGNISDIAESLANSSAKKENARHGKYLKKVINMSVSAVDNINLFFTEAVGEETRGKFDGKNIFLISEKSTTQSKMLDVGIKMSNLEVMAHELVHAMTHAALATNNRLRGKALDLWEVARENITVRDLMTNKSLSKDSNEYKMAEKRHSYIFEPRKDRVVTKINPLTGEKTKQIRSNYLDEFVAFANTNENFMEALAKIQYKKKKKPIRDMLTNLLVAIMSKASVLLDLYISKFDKNRSTFEKLSMLLSGFAKSNANSVDTKAKNLMYDLASVDAKNRSKLKELAFKTASVSDKLEALGEKSIQKFKEESVKALNFVANKIPALEVTEDNSEYSKLVKNTVNSLLTTSKNLISVANNTVGLNNEYSYLSILLDVKDRMFSNQKQGVIASLINEMRGRTPSNSKYYNLMLGRVKNIDTVRQHLKANIVTDLNKAFVEPLNNDQKSSITDNILKTDIAAINTFFGTDAVRELLISPNAVNEYIKKATDVIDKFPDSTFYKNHAHNLGYYQATGLSLLESGVILNAENISSLNFTGESRPLSADNAIGAIDALASLYALKYTDKGSKKLMSELASKEFNKDKLNNGIMYTIANHQVIKNRAKETIFRGSSHLMTKGHIEDITNSDKVIRVGTLEDRKDLEDRGFTFTEERIGTDSIENVKEDLYVYVGTNLEYTNYKAGIFSLEDYKAKGTSISKTRAKTSLNDAELKTLVKKQKKLKQKMFRDDMRENNIPKEISGINVLSPVTTLSGHIKDLRYLTPNSIKDGYLERITQFDEIMATQAGRVHSKTESFSNNDRVVDALHETFVKEYSKNSNKFVEISPYSKNEDFREIWARLPEATRNNVKLKFNTNALYVRNDLVDLVFGYPDVSISKSFSENVDVKNGIAKTFVDTINAIFGKKFGTFLYKGGNLWQEFVGYAKDIIVIKTGFVTLNNIKSNFCLLYTLGVNPIRAARDTAEALKSVNAYKEDSNRLMSLKRDLAAKALTENERNNIRSEIVLVKDKLATNPVIDLINAGVLSTIIEDVDMVDNSFSFKTRVEKKLDPYMQKLPSTLQTVIKEATVASDSTIYKNLRNLAQLSDFTSRYALYKYLREKGMSERKAVETSVDSFIQYDIPTHRNIEFLNTNGFALFTKFLARVQRVIFKLFTEKSARALSLAVVETALNTDFEDISDSTLFLESDPLNKFQNPLDYVSVFKNLVTVQMTESALK